MVQKSIILLLNIFQLISCLFAIDPRIVGGDECNYQLHPYAVAIFFTNSSHGYVDMCGGSLISPEWILTAAHCAGPPGMIEDKHILLRTGFNKAKLVQKRYAIKSVSHDKFKGIYVDLRYDIGLLLAEKPFEKTASLELAILPTPGFASKCKTATAIGIGETSHLEGYRDPQHPLLPRKEIKENQPLRCVNLPIISQDLCSRILWGMGSSYVIDESIICTHDRKNKKDICIGDSGSPLICKGVVIGVHVETGGCAQKFSPSFHINVEHFLDFIAKHALIGRATLREWQVMQDGSNMIVLSRVLLIIVFLLHYYMVFNGFGY